MQSNRLPVILFLDDIILHTIPNNVPPFWMKNGHQKLSLYQLLVISCVYLPPQVMNLTIIFVIIGNIHPVLLPNVFHYDILLLIKVQVYLFRRLSLQHISWYILRLTQTLKHIEICTSFKHENLFNSSIPINSQQFTLFFFWEVWYWLIHLKPCLLFWTYMHNKTITCLSIMPILKFNQ